MENIIYRLKKRGFYFRYGTSDEFLKHERNQVPEDLLQEYDKKYLECTSTLFEEMNLWKLVTLWIHQPDERPQVENLLSKAVLQAGSFSDLAQFYLIMPLPLEDIAAQEIMKRYSSLDVSMWLHWDWRILEKIAKNSKSDFNRWTADIFRDAAQRMDSSCFEKMKNAFATPISLNQGGTDLSKYFK
jgi:hypothetical protein